MDRVRERCTQREMDTETEKDGHRDTDTTLKFKQNDTTYWVTNLEWLVFVNFTESKNTLRTYLTEQKISQWQRLKGQRFVSDRQRLWKSDKSWYRKGQTWQDKLILETERGRMHGYPSRVQISKEKVIKTFRQRLWGSKSCVSDGRIDGMDRPM